MKITPGPWTEQADDTFSSLGDRRIVGANLISPALVFGGLGDETRANARLIAAAPKLLAACQEFVRKVECGEARSRRSYAEMKAIIDEVEA